MRRPSAAAAPASVVSVKLVGDTVDFLLKTKRDKAATRRFLERAINLHDLPEKITIDKSGATRLLSTASMMTLVLRLNRAMQVHQQHR